MTVEELITELEMYDPDADVCIDIKDWETGERLIYEITRSYPDNSGAYPQVCFACD